MKNYNSMKHLGESLSFIQRINDNFNGIISLKNCCGKYFFVNDNWLDLFEVKSEDVIGKSDDEMFSEKCLHKIKLTDAEAFEKKTPVECISNFVVNGKSMDYFTIKRVVNFSSGEPFCICSISDLVQNKESVLTHGRHVDAFLNRS